MKVKVKLNKRQLREMVRDHAWYLKEAKGLKKKAMRLRAIEVAQFSEIQRLRKENAELNAKQCEAKDWGHKYSTLSDACERESKARIKQDIEIFTKHKAEIDELKASMMEMIEAMETFPGMSINPVKKETS